MLISELIIIFAAFSGFLISSHIRNKKRTNQHLVCHLGSDCNTVIHSEFSRFFGIPLEILGMLYYGITAIGHGLILALPTALPSWFLPVFLILAAIGFLFSAYLVFIQGFTLRQWCTWCIFSASLSTAIFAAALVGDIGGLAELLVENRHFIVILHAFAMAIGVGAATITDVFFFKFLKDSKISESESEVLHTLSQIIWAALGMVVITGVGLYLPQAAILNESIKFLLKMFVVLVIIINGAFLNLYISPHLIQISFGASHDHKPGELHHIRKFAFALGSISISSWYTAFILGSIDLLPLSLPFAFALYLAVLAVAITASQILEKLFSRRAFEK